MKVGATNSAVNQSDNDRYNAMSSAALFTS